MCRLPSERVHGALVAVDALAHGGLELSPRGGGGQAHHVSQQSFLRTRRDNGRQIDARLPPPGGGQLTESAARLLTHVTGEDALASRGQGSPLIRPTLTKPRMALEKPWRGDGTHDSNANSTRNYIPSLPISEPTRRERRPNWDSNRTRTKPALK